MTTPRKLKQEHFAVPLDVAARLRAVAAAWGCDTIPDLLAGFVRREIRAGTISADLPGIDLARDDALHITGDGFAATIQRGQIGDLTAGLRKVSRRGGGAAVAGPLELKRTGGSGLKMVYAENGSFIGLTDATAPELADLIEAKAGI